MFSRGCYFDHLLLLIWLRTTEKSEMKLFVYLRVPLLIWCWHPVQTVRADSQQDCTSKLRLWVGILHTQEEQKKAYRKYRETLTRAILKLLWMLMLAMEGTIFHGRTLPWQAAGGTGALSEGQLGQGGGLLTVIPPVTFRCGHVLRYLQTNGPLIMQILDWTHTLSFRMKL